MEGLQGEVHFGAHVTTGLDCHLFCYKSSQRSRRKACPVGQQRFRTSALTCSSVASNMHFTSTPTPTPYASTCEPLAVALGMRTGDIWPPVRLHRSGVT
jgi:hypothetical protein